MSRDMVRQDGRFSASSGPVRGLGRHARCRAIGPDRKRETRPFAQADPSHGDPRCSEGHLQLGAGMSDMGVSIELQRSTRGAPVTGVALGWWKKEGDEFPAAMRDAVTLGAMAIGLSEFLCVRLGQSHPPLGGRL
jgi:hypothetical protein